MAHPFTNMNRSVGFRFNPAAPSRVILVAVNSEILPPIFHRETVLQRMRVVSVPPDQRDDLEPANQLPNVFKRPLPPMPRPQAPILQRVRLVRGEILHDNEGRMYEKSGTNIRPLQQLVSGPQGQVFELFSSAAPGRDLQGSETHIYPQSFESEQSTENKHQTEQTSDASDALPLSSPRSPKRDEREHLTIAQARGHSLAAPYRKLFPDPGLQRLVRFGDFKSLLTPQLRQPERLRDSHWIPCYLQVYEACVPQQLNSLTAALGDPNLAPQFQFLSDALARRLGLAQLVKRTSPISPGMRRPGDILPNERVFRLQVESDPTRENSSLRDDNGPGNPAIPHRTPMRVPDSNAPNSGALKKSIPDRMIKAWEFRISREEVLYDINAPKAFAGYLRSLAHQLKVLIGGRGEMKKWRLLLSGKSADEQLWSVRPPAGSVSHSPIREWARKTLEAAGYDSQAMLLEWEIFWRRKGV